VITVVKSDGTTQKISSDKFTASAPCPPPKPMWQYVAAYQAGHAVADLYCGIPIGCAEIGFRGAEIEGHITESGWMAVDQPRYIFLRGVTCSAGCTAMQLFADVEVGMPDDAVQSGIALARQGKPQHEAAIFADAYLCAAPDADDAEILAVWRECEKAAYALFQHRRVWNAVKRVAKALLERGSLIENDIIRAAKMGTTVSNCLVDGLAYDELTRAREKWLASSRFAAAATAVTAEL